MQLQLLQATLFNPQLGTDHCVGHLVDGNLSQQHQMMEWSVFDCRLHYAMHHDLHGDNHHHHCYVALTKPSWLVQPGHVRLHICMHSVLIHCYTIHCYTINFMHYLLAMTGLLEMWQHHVMACDPQPLEHSKLQATNNSIHENTIRFIVSLYIYNYI